MSAPGQEPVLVTKTSFVATLELNAPPHNPLGMAMVDRLEELFVELASDKSVRAVVLTGSGDRSFSVGADIGEFGAAIAKMGLEDFIGQRLRLVDRIEKLSKPVICAIRGACVGGVSLAKTHPCLGPGAELSG